MGSRTECMMFTASCSVNKDKVKELSTSGTLGLGLFPLVLTRQKVITVLSI